MICHFCGRYDAYVALRLMIILEISSSIVIFAEHQGVLLAFNISKRIHRMYGIWYPIYIRYKQRLMAVWKFLRSKISTTLVFRSFNNSDHHKVIIDGIQMARSNCCIILLFQTPSYALSKYHVFIYWMYTIVFTCRLDRRVVGRNRDNQCRQ